MLDQARRGGKLEIRGDGGGDDRVEIVGDQPGMIERTLRCHRTERRARICVVDDVAAANAGASEDPLLADAEPLGELIVFELAIRDVHTDPGDGGAFHRPRTQNSASPERTGCPLTASIPIIQPRWGEVTGLRSSFTWTSPTACPVPTHPPLDRPGGPRTRTFPFVQPEGVKGRAPPPSSPGPRRPPGRCRPTHPRS